MLWKSVFAIGILICLSAALGACYTSTAKLSKDHKSKKWEVSHTAPVSVPPSHASGTLKGTASARLQSATRTDGSGNYSGKPFLNTNPPAFAAQTPQQPIRPAPSRRVDTESLGGAAYAPESMSPNTFQPTNERQSVSNEQARSADLARISGRLLVVDGRTVSIDGERFQLNGILAPASSQSCKKNNEPYDCGVEASSHLAKLLNGKRGRCELVKPAGEPIPQAVCFVGNEDIGLAQISAGWAVSTKPQKPPTKGRK